ncbi:MAG TPA: zinc-dependent alcohol dehydrogenase family protein [Micropepsaceae bacterium]|nr:zinc-dependent alcohol dehydrogenase family protein [Micropepsaceae bacterium]
MQLRRAGTLLESAMRRLRAVRPGEVRVSVLACAVCRTDLHVIDGELPDPVLPIIPGHEIVGRIEDIGEGVTSFEPGDRVGIPWLGWTDGNCEYCTTGRENLCPNARFTGYQIDGGFAAMTYADARYVFPLPDRFGDAEAAPLLCAGLIGWRSLKAAGRGPRLGLYGFGAAAHIAVQVARFHGQEVFAFIRPNDERARAFALQMGAVWAGPSEGPAPVPLDAAIIFAPAGELVPAALKAVKPGGVVVCGGIHMSDIPRFPYSILWQERSLRSIANLTRADAAEFLGLAEKIPVRTETVRYALNDANRAVNDLRCGALSGAAVLLP